MIDEGNAAERRAFLFRMSKYFFEACQYCNLRYTFKQNLKNMRNFSLKAGKSSNFAE